MKQRLGMERDLSDLHPELELPAEEEAPAEAAPEAEGDSQVGDWEDVSDEL